MGGSAPNPPEEARLATLRSASLGWEDAPARPLAPGIPHGTAGRGVYHRAAALRAALVPRLPAMPIQFGSVRAKLLTLVALPVVLMAVMLPLLMVLLERQLVDEVDDRVVEAKRSLQGELDDDLATLTLMARVLGADPDLSRALRDKDARAATELGRVFSSVHTEVELVFADPAGTVLAAAGPLGAPPSLSSIPELTLKPGEQRGLARHGCGKGAHEVVPARFVVASVGSDGYVLVCQRLDEVYLTNAADKLGLELAATHGASVMATSKFPRGSLTGARAESTLFDAGDVTWAVARIAPSWGTPGEAPIVTAALDVTDVRKIVRHNMLLALGALAVGGVLCLLVGARLAMIMSGALARVSSALKKLEQQEYVTVDVVRTGDELEDLATGFNAMVEGLRERDKLRSTMGKYMTASVMDHLLRGKVALGGETLEVTILFTDIRSFTSISESMSAQELVALLNEYFSEMVTVVIDHQGAVDKYIGDAIMAVFGAPVPAKADPENAVRAAVEMRRALERLNAELERRGKPAIRTGIGIHTGEVVAGNIGSEQRMEYTVIGDAVNLASRLESATKDLGVDILISEATYERVKHLVDARPVKEITVKGRAQPVVTYEVLGVK